MMSKDDKTRKSAQEVGEDILTRNIATQTKKISRHDVALETLHRYSGTPASDLEDVAGRCNVLGPLRRVDGGGDGARPVRGRDAGADPVTGLDRDGKGGLMTGRVVTRHERQLHLAHALRSQGQTDQAAAELGHEVDGLRRRHLSGNDQIALVLALFVIDENDHAAVAGFLDDLVDGGQVLAIGHGQSFSRSRAT